MSNNFFYLLLKCRERAKNQKYCGTRWKGWQEPESSGCSPISLYRLYPWLTLGSRYGKDSYPGDLGGMCGKSCCCCMLGWGQHTSLPDPTPCQSIQKSFTKCLKGFRISGAEKGGAVALPRIHKSDLSFDTPPALFSCLQPTAAPGGSLGSASPTQRVPASPSSEIHWGGRLSHWWSVRQGALFSLEGEGCPGGSGYPAGFVLPHHRRCTFVGFHDSD